MVTELIPATAPAPPLIARPDEPDDADRFPVFPSRGDMQNSVYLHIPGYQAALQLHLSYADDTIVISESPVGWDRSQRIGLLIPDLLVAFNIDVNAIITDGGYAILYQGKPPDFVLEVASKTTSARDEFAKRIGYAAYGIPEYWRFDDTGGNYYITGLAGDRLVDGRYQPIEIVKLSPARCRGYSAALGLYVCWEYGHLRWYHPESGYLPTHFEEAASRRAAEAARAVSEAERIAERAARRTAETARRTAEAERDAERAARLRLEAEIRRLRGS